MRPAIAGCMQEPGITKYATRYRNLVENIYFLLEGHMDYVIEQPILEDEKATETMDTKTTDRARFERIAAQAEAAKAKMGPGYGVNVTSMPREKFITLLRTRIITNA